MKGEAKQLYEAIRQDLIRINAYWQVYRQLFTVSDERYETYSNTAPAFFRLLQDLLVDNAVISLSRLTDPAHYQSFSRLVKALRAQVRNDVYEQLRADLTNLETACADIREHRHKRVAHRPATALQPQITDAPTKLPPLTRKKIEGAMASMASLMNKILGYFEDVEQFYEPVMRGDANALYSILKKGYEAARAPHPRQSAQPQGRNRPNI
jgi:hypothetical protein